jgi:hypothetical protein
MEVLFELLGELIVQLFGELLVEAGWHTLAEPFRREPNPWVAAIGHLLLGALVGGLSLLVFPNHLTPAGAARWLNLALTPVVAGAVMVAVGRWRARRGSAVLPIDRFAWGYLFALALAAVRFHFAG